MKHVYSKIMSNSCCDVVEFCCAVCECLMTVLVSCQSLRAVASNWTHESQRCWLLVVESFSVITNSADMFVLQHTEGSPSIFSRCQFRSGHLGRGHLTGDCWYCWSEACLCLVTVSGVSWVQWWDGVDLCYCEWWLTGLLVIDQCLCVSWCKWQRSCYWPDVFLSPNQQCQDTDVNQKKSLADLVLADRTDRHRANCFTNGSSMSVCLSVLSVCL